jgi:hypothetical protein
MNWEIQCESMAESTVICIADRKLARSVSGQIQNPLDVSPCYKSNNQPIYHYAVCYDTGKIYI